MTEVDWTLARDVRNFLRMLDNMAKREHLYPTGGPRSAEYQAGWRDAVETIRASAVVELLKENAGARIIECGIDDA